MKKFELMVLPYAEDALEPVISKETIAFHYGKHLQAYVDNLNKLLPDSEYEGMTLEEIVQKAPAGAVFNNAGQILNHEMYFGQFKGKSIESTQKERDMDAKSAPLDARTTDSDPKSAPLDARTTDSDQKSAPCGRLAEAIDRDFGSFEAFKTEFEAKGVGLFGSGWVWLSADKDGKLVITQEQGASNPVVKGLKPLLTFDVWEHAYYLDYQNRRAAHLAALWQIVDWKVIGERWVKDS